MSRKRRTTSKRGGSTYSRHLTTDFKMTKELHDRLKRRTTRAKRARGDVEEAIREIGKKVINKVIPVPNILSISGVAQTLTDWIKKKPVPHVKPKYSAWAEKNIKQKQVALTQKGIQADKQSRQSKCYWPYIYRGPNWKKGQPCQDVRYSPDAHKYIY